MISVIVGLGNPGDEYKKTRHNVGFLLLDALAQREGVHFNYDAKFKADVSKCVIGNSTVRLIKPQTFMNKSGLSVSAYAKYYSVQPENVMIVHDELDLEPGIVRLKKGGGHGGHNGLRDIITHLSSKEFYRLRLGVGHPGDRNKVVNYVLKAPSKADNVLIEAAMDRAIEKIPGICAGEIQSVMQSLHTD